MRTNKRLKIQGFTLVETLVVITIIGIIATVMMVFLLGPRTKARDTKRKVEISQIGKFLTLSCYLPDGGEGEYDLVDLAEELLNKYPQYEKYLSQVPRDPKSGSETESKYIYIVNSDGSKCALYANLENESEPITLTITTSTPGGGKGVFKSDSSGWNGSPLYYHYSN
jgi:prepilin-type N-terminal cleavage/methylation domain-containing protein